MILYLNIVANTLHSSVNGLLLMECTCCGPGPPHRVGVLYVGVHHPAKQRFGVCTILILGTQMLPNLHQYSHDCMS